MFNEDINKFDKIINSIDIINNKISNLEEKINCKNCKEKDVNPFTWNYIKKHVFTKKYLFTVIVKSLTKTVVLMFLTLFFLDLWNPFLDIMRTNLPWNNTTKKYFFRESIQEYLKKWFDLRSE